jgi:hypothetical protein
MTYEEERDVVAAYKRSPDAFTEAAIKFCQSRGPCSGAVSVRPPKATPILRPVK